MLDIKDGNKTNQTISFNVEYESSILFSTLSLATTILLAYILYSYYKDSKNNLGTTTNTGLLFFACVSTSLADFLVHNSSSVLIYELHTLVKMLIFGSIMFCMGIRHLFIRPHRESEDETFGEHHSNVSLIVLCITIPLAVLEIGATIIILVDNKKVFYAFVSLSAIIQKIIQGAGYHFVFRHKTPIKEKKIAASFFCKLMALLNFSMWLQSILESENNFDMPDKLEPLRDAFTVIKSTYYALTIDYRLLCALLFLEHSYEISNNKLRRKIGLEYQPSENEHSYVNFPDSREKFYERTKILSKLGFAVGSMISLMQFLNALEYLDTVGPAVNVFGIFAEFSVIVLGYILIRQVRPVSKEKRKWRESNSKGVDLMVAVMGVTGLLFWIFKTFVLITWTIKVSDDYLKQEEMLPAMIWIIVKFIIRTLCSVFLIYLYIRADLQMGCSYSIMYSKLNHFLIPCLTVTFLSVFINCVIDSYHNVIKHIIERLHLNVVVLAFYEASIPIHLGFVLHLFIHYLLIYNKMKAALDMNERRYHIDDILNRHSNNEQPVDEDTYDKIEPLLGDKRKFVTC